MIKIKTLITLTLIYGSCFVAMGEKEKCLVNIDLNETAAVAIAKEICKRVRGKSDLSEYRSFVAVEKQHSWVIRGNPKQIIETLGRPKMKLGGGIEIEIRKSDCCVLSLIRWK